MKFTEMLRAVLTALGFSEDVNAEKLTAEEWNSIKAEFQKQHGVELEAALAEAQKSAELKEEMDKAINMIGNVLPGGEGGSTELLSSVKTLTELITTQNATISDLQEQLKTIASKAAPDTSKTVFTPLSVYGPGNTPEYLFGIENPVFSMKHRFNKVAANKGYAATNPIDEERDGAQLRSMLSEYGKSISSRYAFLKENNMLSPNKLASGEFATHTDSLSSAGLGDQYVQIRQDALIAHVLKRADVSNIFPVRSGVQDRELMTNAFFDSVSQAWQPGHVFKGQVLLSPEMGYVDDAMTKLFFTSFKELERMYIGYLNTNGSDPIKWNMIEWMLVRIYEQMISEQNHRRVMGLYVKPTKGTAGHYLNSASGVFYTLLRYMHECKLLPFSHPAYNNYTQTTMLDAVLEFSKDFQEHLDPNEKASDYTIYLNDRHRPWYLSCLRSKYHLDTDFSGTSSLASKVPDTDIQICWLPNLDNTKLIFAQQPGNVHLLENVPGEMLNVKMKDEMEAVIAWSVWKEGVTASFVGQPHATFEDLKANEYAGQRVFMNLPSVTLEPDATTADGKTGVIFLIGENTTSTSLTDVTNAKRGVGYILRCEENVSNATTIPKSGKFAKITKEFSPSKKGDYILFVLNDSGDGFLELERCEAGKRSINKTLQPNIPGGR